MTATEFRRLALSLPEVCEGAHMGHADFRVGGKIFATLGYPDAQHGMVILPTEAQAEYLVSHPDVFAPAPGAWGAGGATTVQLAALDEATASDALALAWRKRAPRRLVAAFDRPSQRS